MAPGKDNPTCQATYDGSDAGLPQEACTSPNSDDFSIRSASSTTSSLHTPSTMVVVGEDGSLPESDAYDQRLKGEESQVPHPIVIARHAFCKYFENNSKTLIEPREKYLASLSASTSNSEGVEFLRSKMKVKLSRTTDALICNASVAEEIGLQAQLLIESAKLGRDFDGAEVSPADEAICRATIRQLWRDWSAEAQSERDTCFQPILSAISELTRATSVSDMSVLVPGAGLSRLACEIAKIGPFPVVANELSYTHILALHWVLNLQEPKQIYPWVTQFSNHVSSDDQFRSYDIVGDHGRESQLEFMHDQKASSKVTLAYENLRVRPDDFRDYGATHHKEIFSCVVTAFFLDTAPNVLNYIAVIKNVLREGGTWLNVGPLLWNCFENGPGGRLEGDRDDDEAAKTRQLDPQSNIDAAEVSLFDGKVELAWQEVMELIEHMGFEIQENIPKLGSTGYILDQQSMLLPLYQVGFFRVVKRAAK